MSREVNFTSEFKMKDFRLEQRVLLHDRPFERWNFRFGFVMPGSTNTWQQVIEAADEMLPVEVLDGNVVIETSFFDGQQLISQCRVRIFARRAILVIIQSRGRVRVRSPRGRQEPPRASAAPTATAASAQNLVGRLPRASPLHARSATAFSPPLWRRIIFSAFARSRSNVKPVCSPLRASVNAQAASSWSRVWTRAVGVAELQPFAVVSTFAHGP